MKLVSTTALLVSLLAATSLQAKWSRIPIMKEKPVDIATTAPGSVASLDSSSGFGKVDSLLSDDITAAATVSAGKSFAIINLGKPVLISQSSFVNDGIEGRATLSASADKQGWAVLEEKVFSAADRTVEFKFAGIQAKFVKLEFALSKGGLIRNFRFYGGQTDRGYAVKQDAEGKQGKPMDFLGGLGGGRIVYLAPKPAGGVDTAVTYNKLAFPESDEKYRTVIYDLGQLRVLNKFSSVHSPRPVRFEVFAFDNLPEKEDWRGHMAFNPEEFNAKAPVAIAEDTSGAGELTATPSKPVKTRYLALRWEPEFNPPDFQCTGSSVGNVTNIVTTNTVTITNADGTKTTVTIEVGDAHGAGAATSDVSPEGAQQQIAQGTAVQGDTTKITTTVTDAAGNVVSQTTQQGSTTTSVTTSSNGTTTTQTETTNSDGTSTTITETKTADGQTTTTVATTDAQGNTTTQTGDGAAPTGTSGGTGDSGGTTDGSGNLGSTSGAPGDGGALSGTGSGSGTTPPVTSP
jgi:hypothetical protein